MRRVVFRAHAGMCGTDTAEFMVFSDDTTDDELSDQAWEFGLDHAASYGVYPMGEMPEDYDEDEADWRSDEYSDNIEGWWEPYNPEEHDGLRVGYQEMDEIWADLEKQFGDD